MITSTEGLYRKLERTSARRDTYGDNQVDWVFDLCLTAWHLVDWFAWEQCSGQRLKSVQADIRKRQPPPRGSFPWESFFRIRPSSPLITSSVSLFFANSRARLMASD